MSWAGGVGWGGGGGMRRSGSGTHVVIVWVRGWMLFNLSHLLARLCSPPTARARGHAAAAVLGLRKRPGLPSHPPPSPPLRGTRRGARLDLHPALLPLSVLLADPARRLPALAHTTHSSLPFRCSGELLGGGEGPRSRACGGRPLRRCAVGAGILVDRFLGGIACFRRAYRHPLEAAPR